MSYKQFINSNFAGCRLLAETRDIHRNRDVRVYMLPTDRDHVGVSDGVDCWIAPVVADPFQVDVRKLIADIDCGVERPVVQAKRQRLRVLDQEEPQQQKGRVRVQVQ